jgi:hypothetical protein
MRSRKKKRRWPCVRLLVLPLLRYLYLLVSPLCKLRRNKTREREVGRAMSVGRVRSLPLMLIHLRPNPKRGKVKKSAEGLKVKKKPQRSGGGMY